MPGNEDDLHLLFQKSTLIRVLFGASPGQRPRNVLVFFDSRAHPTEGRHSFSAEGSEAMECWCGIAGGSCVHLAHLAHSLRYPCGSSRDRNCRWRTRTLQCSPTAGVGIHRHGNQISDLRPYISKITQASGRVALCREGILVGSQTSKLQGNKRRQKSQNRKVLEGCGWHVR